MDAWTHDARLCLANVRAAAEGGAAVANYAEVVSLRRVAGRIAGADVQDVLTGELHAVEARAVVNATGPWLDRIRLPEDADARPLVRLSKGVHVLLPLERPWSAALTVMHDPVRVTFAYPWLGQLMLGTTDTLYEGDPADAAPTEAEVAQVLAEAGAAVDPACLRPERVVASFAGLRVLPGAEGDTVSARRETVYVRGRGGMLTVAGGKLTTYRKIAQDALEQLRPELGLPRLDRRPAPLPGARGLEEAGRRLGADFPELDPGTRSHLLPLYGSLAEEVLAPAREDRSLLEPIAQGGPDVRAQVAYAYEREWAVRPDDVALRRTTVGLRGLDAVAEERLRGILPARGDAG
jgi:glycerol-3-phosphate dehydrogenase